LLAGGRTAGAALWSALTTAAATATIAPVAGALAVASKLPVGGLLGPWGRRGGWRREGGRLGVRRGDEGRWRSRGRVHVELGQAEVGPDVVEGGEGLLPGDELRHELKTFVEATQDI